VQIGDGLSLLSPEGIALWLAKQLQAEMNMTRVTLANALVYEHPENAKKAWAVAPRRA